MNRSLDPGRPARALALAAAVLAASGAVSRDARAAPGDVTVVVPSHAPAKGTPFDVQIDIDSGAAALGGYELRLSYDPTVLEYQSGLAGTATGFTNPIYVAPDEIAGGAVRFGAYQRVSRTQPAGVSTVASVRFRAIGMPGTASPLDVSILKLLTPEVEDLAGQDVDGVVVINLLPLGDVNGDGVPNQVSDAVFLTRALLGYETLSAAESSSSDANADGAPETVADLVYLVNVLLGLQPPLGKDAAATAAPLVVSLGTPDHEGEWLLVPVLASSSEPLGGLLLDLEVDPSRLELGEPRPGPRAARMSITTARPAAGGLTVLVHSDAAERVAAGVDPLLWLPVRPLRQDATDALAVPSAGGVALRGADAATAAGVRRVVAVGDARTEVAAAPSRLALHDNAPNPFNPRTDLRFDLPGSGRARLAVYDSAGRLVRTLLDRELPPGAYRLPWDGTDDRGVAVASGVYHARLDAAGQAAITRKMVLVR